METCSSDKRTGRTIAHSTVALKVIPLYPLFNVFTELSKSPVGTIYAGVMTLTVLDGLI